MQNNLAQRFDLRISLPGLDLRLDHFLLWSAALLVCFGFVMMSSASVEYADVKLGSVYYHMTRQLIYIAISMVVGAIIFCVPTGFWYRQSWLLLAIGFALLILVVIPGIGRDVNGSRRWLPVGPVNIQSSELAKFCILIYIAAYLVRRNDEVRSSWSGFFKPIGVLCGIIILLLLEPDFGAVVVMVSACLGMIFLGGVRISQFFALIVTSVIAFAVMAVSSSYRMQRLSCFVDPWERPFDCGYQLTQSLIAFGRGEWFGLGLGNSIQKLFYLPEAHTDFVFAIIAEELGFFGALAVIVLFAVMIWRVFTIARSAEMAEHYFSAYVCYGMALIISAQVFINIGVNTGLLPTKGLTLPLLSYGGSSLIVMFAFIAFIQRVHHEVAIGEAPQKALKTEMLQLKRVRRYG